MGEVDQNVIARNSRAGAKIQIASVNDAGESGPSAEVQAVVP
jgi:hypothetical protein